MGALFIEADAGTSRADTDFLSGAMAMTVTDRIESRRVSNAVASRQDTQMSCDVGIVRWLA